MSFVPRNMLSSGAFYAQPGGRILFLLVYVLFALASAAIAYISLSRKQARTELRENEARLREITSTLSEGLLVMDKYGRITYANPAACTTLGYTEQELLGQDMHDYLHAPRAGDTQLPRSECPILQVMQSGACYRAHEEAFRRKDGVLLPVAVSAAPIIRGSGISGIVVAFHDITERKQAEMALRKDGTVLPILLSAAAVFDAEGHYAMSRSTLFDLTERKKMERLLQQQARTDALTGLVNRRHFYEQAEAELARARRHNEPFSLLLLDVDHFKAVNDNYGHHTGDVALQKLSEVCIQTFREIDLVARLGGEEFAVAASTSSDVLIRPCIRQKIADATGCASPELLNLFFFGPKKNGIRFCKRMPH